MKRRPDAVGRSALIGRRDFIAMLGGVAAAWPIAVRAATPSPRLAILSLASKAGSMPQDMALLDGLKGLGYVEGTTLAIDERYADGDTSRLAELTRELLQSKPAVMFASAPSALIAANHAAPTLPIVSALLTPAMFPHPVASYAHPGGSVTGISQVVPGMFGKLVELTRDAIPGVGKIGLLVNPSTPDSVTEKEEIAPAAQATGIELVIAEATTIDALRSSLQRLTAANVQALIVPGNGLFVSQQPLLVELTMASRVPLIFQDHSLVEQGGLAGYGVDVEESTRRAAGYIDKILKGASPVNRRGV